MDKRVLVTYGTKYGATAEIAEKIGQVLRQAGLQADILPADRAGDPSNYQAVVLGSGVYIGRWRKEAVRFVQQNEKVLASRPVWLFSSGPTGEGDPSELVQGWRFPGSLQASIDKIQPRDIAVFHGAIDLERLSFIEKWMIKNVGAPVGDYRDWQAVASWATTIANELKASVVP